MIHKYLCFLMVLSDPCEWVIWPSKGSRPTGWEPLLYKNTNFGHTQLVFMMYIAWTHENFSQVVSLHSQGINCLSLWIKLTIAWDFRPPHLLAPFSQVPLLLERWQLWNDNSHTQVNIPRNHYKIKSYTLNRLGFQQNYKAILTKITPQSPWNKSSFL